GWAATKRWGSSGAVGECWVPDIPRRPPVVANSVFVPAQDGLRLHVREIGERPAGGLPVVCLPGLARTTADFDALAAALASERDRPRRGGVFDYRGRGLSEYGRNPHNYSIPAELAY